MRYFSGCLALLFAVVGCSSMESTQDSSPQETQSEILEQESPIPTWYNPGIHSSTDSLAIHGYSLASATDSSRAVEISTQMALEYLRFEIDRVSERVRKELGNVSSEMADRYNSPTFIIHLRNTVSEFQLVQATFSFEYESTDQGVHYSYVKASVLRTELPDLFENHIDDEVFIQEIGTYSP